MTLFYRKRRNFMPSTYAHYRLGKEVSEKLSGTPAKLVSEYPDLFYIGLHGPDILFYYGALGKNSVNAVGHSLHKKSGTNFFENAREVILKSGNPDASRAYAYGVLCHFALDVKCHPCVSEKIRTSGITHTEIEVEFDRKLMLVDGLDPVTHVLTDHIKPTDESCEIIAPFYSGVTPKQIKKALRSMIFLNRLLLAKTTAKRKLIYAVLRITGNYKQMHGFVVNPDGNPECADSNDSLYALYNEAEKLAEKFISDFEDYLNGKACYGSIFDYNFDGKLTEEKKAE